MFNRFVEDLFISQWHDTMDVMPETGDDVWFIYEGNIEVGMFESEQNVFCMSDGMGIPAEEVRQWMYADCNKHVSGYPKERQEVAVEIPELGCLSKGFFTSRFIDESEFEPVRAVVLSDIYEFSQTKTKAVSWDNVFSWYDIPELPLKIIDVNSECIEEVFVTDSPLTTEVPVAVTDDVLSEETPFEQTEEVTEDIPVEKESSSSIVNSVRESKEDKKYSKGDIVRFTYNMSYNGKTLSVPCEGEFMGEKGMKAKIRVSKVVDGSAPSSVKKKILDKSYVSVNYKDIKSKQSLNESRNRRLKEGPGAGYKITIKELELDLSRTLEIIETNEESGFAKFKVDIVPNKYDISVEHSYWGGDSRAYIKGTLYGYYEGDDLSRGSIEGDLPLYTDIEDWYGSGYLTSFPEEKFVIGDEDKQYEIGYSQWDITFTLFKGESEDLGIEIENLYNEWTDEDEEYEDDPELEDDLDGIRGEHLGEKKLKENETLGYFFNYKDVPYLDDDHILVDGEIYDANKVEDGLRWFASQDLENNEEDWGSKWAGHEMDDDYFHYWLRDGNMGDLRYVLQDIDTCDVDDLDFNTYERYLQYCNLTEGTPMSRNDWSRTTEIKESNKMRKPITFSKKIKEFEEEHVKNVRDPKDPWGLLKDEGLKEKKSIKESVSVNESNVYDVYEMCLETLGSEYLLMSICKALDSEELKDVLEYIIRVYELDLDIEDINHKPRLISELFDYLDMEYVSYEDMCEWVSRALGTWKMEDLLDYICRNEDLSLEDDDYEEVDLDEDYEEDMEGLKIEDGYVYLDGDIVGSLGRHGEAIYNPMDDEHPEVEDFFMDKGYIIKNHSKESLSHMTYSDKFKESMYRLRNLNGFNN